MVEKLGTAPDDVFAQYDMVTSMIYLRKENIKIRKNGSDIDTLIGNEDLGSALKIAATNAIASTLCILLSISIVFWKIYHKRSFVVHKFIDFILRLIYCFVICTIIRRDFKPIEFSEAITQWNLCGPV